MLYAVHESKKPGSDWTCIAHDLKTVRGMQNRIVRGKWPAGQWQIYRCSKEDWYKSTGHQWAGRVIKRAP